MAQGGDLMQEAHATRPLEDERHDEEVECLEQTNPDHSPDHCIQGWLEPRDYS